MSGLAPSEAQAKEAQASEAGALGVPPLRIRAAEPGDVEGVVAAVGELLLELGAGPPPAREMEAAARALLADPSAGALLVADENGALVGVLSASWQSAIHIPGRYGLIQDLWVHRARRGRAIGGALIEALAEHARQLGIARLEVGLPRAGFAGLKATEAFYRANGFDPLGQRMRRLSR